MKLNMAAVEVFLENRRIVVVPALNGNSSEKVPWIDITVRDFSTAVLCFVWEYYDVLD